MLNKKYWLKLLLNIAIITLEVLVIYKGYMLFTHKQEPVQGVLIFLGIITLLILSWKKANGHGFRRQRPGLLKTTLVILAVTIICTFAGIQPLSTYKDNFFDNLKTRQAKWTEEQKERKIEQKEEKIKETQTAIEELETEVLLIVNLIRTDRGSSILLWDNELYQHSKAHSEVMALREEMFHSDINLPYGENAWWGGGHNWKAWDIVDSWIDSPTHRTWLLCPHLKHIATSIAISNSGDTYASWTFWRDETEEADWWYTNDDNPPSWWELDWKTNESQPNVTSSSLSLSGTYTGLLFGIEQSWTFQDSTVIRFDEMGGKEIFEYTVEGNSIHLKSITTGKTTTAPFKHNQDYNFIKIHDTTFWREE